jgi:type IV secretory pathway TrbL component
MMKSVLRIGALGLLAAAIAGTPAQLLAQSTNNPTAAKKTSAAKKEAATKTKGAHPFRGKLAAVDKIAKTIKVGESVYQITSETKITKDGKPATLEDGIVGEPVTGYVKPAEGGKMAATTVRFGAKADEKGGSKKKEQ